MDKGTLLSRTTVQHVTIDETKYPDIAEKIKSFRDKLDENLTDPKYIDSDLDFEGFIMDDYLPRQVDELPSNKWEEEYQGIDDLPEVDEIDACGCKSGRWLFFLSQDNAFVLST